MKKKGFTLIELLAVIVILAIIALIATPLVLKYIEKSRKESKVDSAYSFVRNLETEIANYSIKNNGKKYNGQPTDKGYYELTSFENSEIDTTVKGDKPNSIKVCLSSLGQVEKAMFEYGKYYVSYDGKKGSISDKDTYDNFSCSSNVENAVIIPKQEVEFSYDSDIEIYMGVTTFDLSNLEVPELYNLIIDETQVYPMVNSYVEGVLTFVDETTDVMIRVLGDTMQVAFRNEFLDKHTVELVRSNENLNPRTIVRVLENGKITVSSADLFGGDSVSVVIKDLSNDNVLADISTIVEGQNSISSFYTYEYYEDLYEAIQNGTKISIVVTRVRHNEEEKIIFSSSDTPIYKDGTEWPFRINYYYIGNNILPLWALST